MRGGQLSPQLGMHVRSWFSHALNFPSYASMQAHAANSKLKNRTGANHNTCFQISSLPFAEAGRPPGVHPTAFCMTHLSKVVRGHDSEKLCMQVCYSLALARFYMWAQTDDKIIITVLVPTGMDIIAEIRIDSSHAPGAPLPCHSLRCERTLHSPVQDIRIWNWTLSAQIHAFGCSLRTRLL